MENFYLIKILLLSSLASIFTILWTPILTKFLYKYKLGKKIRDDGTTPIYTSMHKYKSGTPTMGGILIWMTTLIFAFLFYYLSKFSSFDIFKQLNFLSRSQTWLPLAFLISTAIIGLIDDIMGVKEIGYKKRGIKFLDKLAIYTIIGLVGATWFYYKLGWDLLHIPFLGNFQIGILYIPIFISVVIGTAFAVNQTDGLDGLAGGSLLTAFVSYIIISFALGKYDLAAFCSIISGALMAFLWFNIKPARFIMGDTGAFSLGSTLAIIALLTNTIFILPFIGFIFVIEALSTIIQIGSKKLRKGKKVFISSPIHHHLEAKGWTESKIVMRSWIISELVAMIGLVIFLLDKNI